ncbi:type I-F CRISPR-associated helicase Cas3f [Acinetobacter pullicarnis]|uniref:type I-F CRISPR-associated helicase Cas3f n=1 Tax=Acinetobacter pullicarnis TaxID=2576829 RepID=UPI00111F1C1C|nr:type I-F CRISPR-associated helicase Cas3f [Acinetobacter pullicarnis]
MHTIFISACEKRAIKKTRAVLDSYAIRIGQATWQAPMTEEGLKEIRAALKKTATRQTAVAAYKNYGMRRMKLVWIVGSKQRFALDGIYPVASTQKQQKQLNIENWVRAASLLAGAAGDVHDIGKASVHFQNKLSPENANQRIKDEIRHEWLSMKLLQKMRKNDWNWPEAWQGIERKIGDFSLGHREQVKRVSIADELEAVDYLVVSHHGLLGGAEKPNADLHVSVKTSFSPDQICCAGEIKASIFKSHQHRMARLVKLNQDISLDILYWKALTLHARAALIHADHIVSAQQFSANAPEIKDGTHDLFANTKIKTTVNGVKKKLQDQPLSWHLEQVGERASYIATKMATDLNLTGLSEQTVEYICQRAEHSRFQWQNTVANTLQKLIVKHPNIPSLVLNIAGTGSGKTRMNLRAACTLRPEDPRIAIALNLRSLTLQTGEALKNAMHLSDDELSVIIGDKVTQQLFNQRQQQHVDEDENQPEPMFDAFGEENSLPSWLDPLFEKTVQGRKAIDHQAKTVLSSPLLVSTIDYLIAAGEPHRQGHHVKALLRIISSDLILDEIDGYEPTALVAVLRLVQLAAMYGRHVICSSATLAATVAESIYRAFESGIEMRQALYQAPQQFIVAIADNALTPKAWLNDAKHKQNFSEQYQQHLNDLQAVLLEKAKKPYRLARLAEIADPTVAQWKATILAEVQALHADQGWAFADSGKNISFGLVRVANIKHAIALAKYLSEHLSGAQIACYHANDWLISRFHKEQRLDFLLTRHIDGKKRKTGNEHILLDDEIRAIVKNSDHQHIPFIVIATPVEEVGRDHDFDWAVIDASSIQSIVQTAGRVNRHRLKGLKQPNIVIPQFNYRYCQNKEAPKVKKMAAFKWPGFESYQSSSKENIYKTQDLSVLLPWENGQLVIDACLRFDQLKCQFAAYDDAQIEAFCKEYFHPSGHQLFASDQVDSCLLTEGIYKETALRGIQRQEVYIFDYDDQLKVINKNDRLELNPATRRYEPSKKPVNFAEEAAPQNAWLAMHPQQLIELSAEYGLSREEGCKASLAVYSDEIPQWTYHYGFGLYR